jgi:hypothetical protein
LDRDQSLVHLFRSPTEIIGAEKMNRADPFEAVRAEVHTHGEMRRMPALLGLASGPRNMPRNNAHLTYTGDILQVTVQALTDEARLSRYLPPRCRLAGEPILSVSVTQLRNLGWLAGRGYNFVTVSTPVVFEGDLDVVTGDFSFCLWESKADPIMTGRDEIGMPKLFADIPDPREVDGRWACSASWEGFSFLQLELDTNVKDANPVPPSGVYLLHRYHARPGEWDKVDIDEIIYSHAGEAPPTELLEHRVGAGSFRFRPARWEDMPTQYTYVNALGGLPLIEERGGFVVKAKGISDLRAFRIAK